MNEYYERYMREARQYGGADWSRKPSFIIAKPKPAPVATATVTRGPAPKPPVGEITSVTLTLTPEVAQSLRAVCSKIGGDPVTSRRGDIDAIAKAIDASGLVRDYSISNGMDGQVYFPATRKAPC